MSQQPTKNPKQKRPPHPTNPTTQSQPMVTPSSASNRAAATSVTIGADLLSQPAPVSRDLSHLVGRPLVPFFTSDGEENATHDLGQNEDLDFGIDEDERGQATQVRAFVDGYFVNQGSLAQTSGGSSAHTTTTATATTNPHANHTAANYQQNKPTKQNKQQNKQQQQQQQQKQSQPQPQPQRKQASPPVPAPVAAAASTGPKPKKGTAPTPLYAGAAFLASPSPLQVPLPKFLTSGTKPTPPSPSSAAGRTVHTTGSSHAHPNADAHASQSLLNLIRGAPPSPKPVLHPPSPNSAAAAAAISYAHSIANQPTLIPPPQPIPSLPTHPAQPHHYGSGIQPPPYHPYPYGAPATQPSYYSAATPAYSQPTSNGSSAATAVPLPSAVYSRYDRPQVQSHQPPVVMQPSYYNQSHQPQPHMMAYAAHHSHYPPQQPYMGHPTYGHAH